MFPLLCRDRIRTTANGYSHVLCCVMAWRLCKDTMLVSPDALMTEHSPQVNGKGASVEEKKVIIVNEKDFDESS